VHIEHTKTEAGTRRVRLAEPLLSLLQRATATRKEHGPTGRLFPRTRRWVLYWTKRMCERADVPTVTAHGLRGLHATLATEAGATSALVAAQLGHAGTAVTEPHYTERSAKEGATRARVLHVLQGGLAAAASGSQNEVGPVTHPVTDPVSHQKSPVISRARGGTRTPTPVGTGT
jgi:integrase